jgi:hypothetical protein
MTLRHRLHDIEDFDNLWRINWKGREQGGHDDLNNEVPGQWRTEGGGFGGSNPPPKFRNFDKVPKIKKILLYGIKFLVPNYSCLQNPWLRGHCPRSLFSLSSTEFVEPPPRKKFLGTLLIFIIIHHHVFISIYPSSLWVTNFYTQLLSIFPQRLHLTFWSLDMTTYLVLSAFTSDSKAA